MKLVRSEAMLLVIDVQQKLMPVIHDGEALLRNIERLVRGCRTLDVPIVVTEQYVRGLGPTVEPLRRALEESGAYEPAEKNTFSAFGSGEFTASLRVLKKKHVLVAGVEAHVCVYQTVTDLIAAGYAVSLVADAISSRTARNRELATQRMLSEGALLTSTEMALFEMTVTSGTDEFRAISRLIK